MKNYFKIILLIGLSTFLLPRAEAARVIFSGFEGGANECDVTAGTFSFDTTTFHSGLRSLRTNPVGIALGSCRINGYLATGLAGNAAVSEATAYYKFGFRADTIPTSTEYLFAARDTLNATKVALEINSNGTLTLINTVGTAIGTSTTALASATWYYLEILVGTGASANFELKINGTSEFSGTSNLGNTNNGSAFLGKIGDLNGSNVDFYYDDVSVDNAAYPGDTHIVSLSPNATGTTQQWTAGAGNSNWSSIDEKVAVFTDYVKNPVAGDKTISQHNLEDTATPGISGTMNGVMIISAAREDSTGVSLGQIGIWSNAVIASTTGTNLSTANSILGKYAVTDPNTGTAWTTSGIDAVEAGFIDGAGATVQLRGTWLLMNVDYTSSTQPPPIAIRKRIIIIE